MCNLENGELLNSDNAAAPQKTNYDLPEGAVIKRITKEGNILYYVDRGWYFVYGVQPIKQLSLS